MQFCFRKKEKTAGLPTVRIHCIYMRDSYGYLAADPHFMQVSWLMDYCPDFPSQIDPVVDFSVAVSVRLQVKTIQLQWRDRAGFSPASLLAFFPALSRRRKEHKMLFSLLFFSF